MSTDRNAMVLEFFRDVAPNQERRDTPGIPSEETIRLRMRMIFEEVGELAHEIFDNEWAIDEFKAACDWLCNHARLRRDLPSRLPEIADAQADIAYVNEGFAVACGVDLNGVLGVVHAANMRKKDGPIVDGKRMKPRGWIGPDVVGELRRQGWSE